MERPVARRLLTIKDENSTIHRRKAAIDGKSKSLRPISKKGGAALESRKALNDITNKKVTHVEALSQNKSSQIKKSTTREGANSHHHVGADVTLKKKSSVSEKINIAEEGFLHDHIKCIEAQKAGLGPNFWDTVLPGHGSADLMIEKAKDDPDIGSTRDFPEPEELSMEEFSNWFDSWWKSPPVSPARSNSPPSSPFAWDLDLVEFVLKEEDQFHV